MDSAKPGDLIQIFRGTYEHWAIYMGGNKVVHLIPSSPYGNLGFLMDSSTAQVRCQNIWQVVRHDDFRINNLLDDEYEPRERHLILRDAHRLVGQRLPYCITTHNCEHFVTQLRYGKPESRQVKNVAVMGGVALAGVGIVALGAALFSLLNEEDNKRRHK
uniref:LRAT domain-containing protein n=1 Tax=Mola mola TaxID=94237 RepID=A0A3Q3XRB6_MOLML